MKNLIPLMLLIMMCINKTAIQSQNYNQTRAANLANGALQGQAVAGLCPIQNTKLTPCAFAAYKDSLFRAHGHLMEAILTQYGFPGYDLVGKKGSYNFWLMAQHCDYNPTFQEDVLAAMKIQVAKRNA